MSKLLPIRGCKFCFKPFRPNRPWQQFCGMSCRRAASNDDIKIEYVCTYCGVVGETIDHVPPTSIRPMLVELGLAGQYPFIIVRACKECNCALGDRAYWTVEQRRAYIAKWLTRRYRKYLGLPEWTQKNLDGLEYNLRQLTMHGLAVKQLITARIARATSEESYHVERLTSEVIQRDDDEKEYRLEKSKTFCQTCGKPTQDDAYCSIECAPDKKPNVVKPVLTEKQRIERRLERLNKTIEKMKARMAAGET